MVEKRTAAYIRYTLVLVMTWRILATGAHVLAAGHVADEAGLFTYSETKAIEEAAAKWEDDTKMNFLALTVDEAYSMEASEVAERFYVEGGYDTDGKRGGAVFLIDMDNRELYVATHGVMIYYLTDERIEQILDDGFDYAADGDYGRAMLAMIRRAGGYVNAGIPSNQYRYDTETGKVTRYRSVRAADLAIALAGALLLAGGVCFSIYRTYSVVKPYEYAAGQNADMRLTDKQDRLVNQFVTQRRIPRNPPPNQNHGGGGFSGRSSTHSGMGGNTFGGGGRKF